MEEVLKYGVDGLETFLAIAQLAIDTENYALFREYYSRACVRSFAIDRAVEALADGTEAFAALRMNRGIQAALTGRKVEDL